MKIKITSRGWLEIERSGVFKSQYCPKKPSDEDIHCGDWCPLFGDVHRGVDGIVYQSNLRICDVSIEGDIIDERKSE